MRHLKVRSPAGLVLQEEFAAFAANFVRWAAVWLHQTCRDASAPFNCPQPGVKRMVRIAAHTSAWVRWQARGCLLTFTELSAFAGVELVIRDAVPVPTPLAAVQKLRFCTDLNGSATGCTIVNDSCLPSDQRQSCPRLCPTQSARQRRRRCSGMPWRRPL